MPSPNIFTPTLHPHRTRTANKKLPPPHLPFPSSPFQKPIPKHKSKISPKYIPTRRIPRLATVSPELIKALKHMSFHFCSVTDERVIRAFFRWHGQMALLSPPEHNAGVRLVPRTGNVSRELLGALKRVSEEGVGEGDVGVLRGFFRYYGAGGAFTRRRSL